MISTDELMKDINREAERLVKERGGGDRRVRVHPETFRRLAGDLGATVRYTGVQPAFASAYFSVHTMAGLWRVEADAANAPVADHLYFVEAT